MDIDFDIDEWLSGLSYWYLDDDVTSYQGIEVSVNTTHSNYDKYVEQTVYLVAYNVTYRRTGVKIIEYERWVDDSWNDWELID